MNFRITLLCIALLVGFSAAAQDESQITAPITYVKPARGIEGFTIGYEFGVFDYNEPGYMRDHGSMNGIKATETILIPNSNVLLMAEGDWMYGKLEYDGSTWQGASLADESVDYEINLRGLVGMSFGNSQVALIPFSGVGLRYLNDNGTDTSTYEREISYLYVPVGAKLRIEATQRVRFGISAEFDQLMVGQAKSHLSQAIPNDPDITNTQSSGQGFRVAASVDYQFAKIGLRVEPYFQRWTIGTSDSQTINAQSGQAFEPANQTDQYGLSIQVEI